MAVGARARLGIAAVTVLINALILVHFHDQFWWAPDEGNYAHVAERVLDGEVLHADVQDIHPGYVNFTNAAALGLFGRELVSMRYPLVALGIIQCAIVFFVLAPLGILASVAGATAITALGFVQFLDPTAHWYALFFVILLAGVLHGTQPGTRWRLDAIGAIVMMTVLFRQLSGVFVAMGALTWLLLEHSRGAAETREASPAHPWLARTLTGVMLVGLIGYLARATELVGWLLFGVWPVMLLLWTLRVATMPNGALLGALGRMARGGAIAALPLVGYHVVHGSLDAWYRDVVLTALSFPRMPFFDTMNYGDHIATAIGSVLHSGAWGVVTGLLWVSLALLATVAGTVLLRQLVSGSRPPAALPVLAVFYGVVSVHYQIPIYLGYTAGLSLLAVLWLGRGRMPVALGTLAVAAVALVFHAGQPLSRGVGGLTDGVRIALDEENDLPRVGLRVERADVELYRAVLAVIDRNSPPGSTILAVPSHAELYFLAERRNPFTFFNTALGIRTDADLQRVLTVIEREPPALVFHDEADKYNTAASHAIMNRVEATYEELPPIGPFRIFRWAGDSVAAGERPQSSRE